ncbi:MAG TPA: glycoside hydrolase family 31 protein [Candidatus Blautia stercoravium]|nr:glycoside hydrolase family 31 protein [Candidatus Blautia stercoravium]
MQTMRKEGHKLIYEYNGEVLQIEPWGKNSLRVRSAMMRDIQNTDFALLADAGKGEGQEEIQTGTYESSIENGKLKAVMEVSDYNHKCRISFYNKKGKLLLEEYGDGGALNLDSRSFRPILGGDFGLTVTFSAQEEEKLYGMGQYQQDILDLKGCSLELAHRNSQASVPFLLSSRGYGFLWHNPAIGNVTFGKNKTIWQANSTKQMDYWITAGDDPDEIERAYALATGTVPMMPEYGMGFWQCKLRYWNQEQLLEVAREYHKKGIPVDVIVCDFFHWPHMGDYRFEEEFFPDPEAMVQELKSMGMELMVSVWPQVDLKSENFAAMKQKGLLVKSERGVEIAMRFGGESTFYDATNPKARSYVWEKCKKNYYDKGIRIFWLDEAEPEYTVYDFDNYRYYMGPNVQIGNLYPQAYAKTFYEGQRMEGQEKVVNLLRCAWAGSQRYGALVWSGDIHSDWETLRRQLCAGLHMGIAGIPWWTTDIGGFSGGNPKEEGFRQLLVRWFEWGTFCPVMRLHGDRNCEDRHVYRKDGSEALFTGGENEIWSFGEENEKILKKYILFREAMRPYVRVLMEEAHRFGRPVMRPMFYEFPQEEICWELKEQYMFGSDMLVAPVLYENAVSREVYLPKGASWTMVSSGQVWEGGQTVTVDAPLEEIPVFLRDGRRAELIGKI